MTKMDNEHDPKWVIKDGVCYVKHEGITHREDSKEFRRITEMHELLDKLTK